MFSRLVDNGFDFLSKAISELKEQPKYSIIHFHAAVELFVKARLMHEHWSLVVTKRQEPEWEKFVNGDFQSVSLDEAASRLRKIVRSGLSKADLESFKEIANHRNKLVHFFHEAHTDNESNKLKRVILKQQLKAWYFLHRLLTKQWDSIFSGWNDKIADIDSDLRKLHEFLQVVFDNLEQEIEALKKKGVLFEPCPSCHFEAQQHGSVSNTIYESKCLVCGLVEKSLKIECSGCSKIITFKGEGTSKCPSCGKLFEPEDVANVLIDSGAAHIAAMEGDSSWGEGNCSECDGYHTVVRTENDEWICASCFSVFDTLECCEWCNELNSGDMEGSYVAGCNRCEGMAGWHSDD